MSILFIMIRLFQPGLACCRAAANELKSDRMVLVALACSLSCRSFVLKSVSIISHQRSRRNNYLFFFCKQRDADDGRGVVNCDNDKSQAGRASGKQRPHPNNLPKEIQISTRSSASEICDDASSHGHERVRLRLHACNAGYCLHLV